MVCWTAMIVGYAEEKDGEVALESYARMQQEGVVPDAQALVGALKACSSLAASEEWQRDDGILLKKKSLHKARAVHTDVSNRELESDMFIGNSLVDVYTKCGSLVDARRVFEKMPRRDVVSWNTMILGYAQVEECEEALKLYAQMQKEGLLVDARAFVGALKACISLATSKVASNGGMIRVKERTLEQVRAIHSRMVEGRCDSNIYAATMLVDAYAKCGSLVDARRVFEEMSRRDVVSWGAMILGYSQMEEGEVALQLYTRMQQGVVPDRRSFVGALTACGSVARLEKGKEIHAQVCELGPEATDSFVASSLIDMYGKCGSMLDAKQVFEALPTRDVVTWNALISGYARQGESEPVFELFEQMEQMGMQPEDTTFLSLLTVCSHVGLVDKGQMYFEAMSREFGITPRIEHYSCMIDLLGRAGHVDKAMAVARTMPLQSNSSVWRSLLGACQKWSVVELGRQAFELAVRLDRDDAAAYVLMSNIYAAAHMEEDARAVQAMGEQICGAKKP